MKVLLDTHFVIWLATEPHLIRPSELTTIRQHLDRAAVSVVSLWEIRTKSEALDRRGDKRKRCSVLQASDFINEAGFPVETLTQEAVVESLSIDLDHTDPFDRMLLVHAQYLGARLLTRDRRLAAHPLSLPL